MQVTRRTEYAVLCVKHLAENPGVCDISEIATVQKLPESVVAKIMQQLVKAGIATSRRGLGGGFCLTLTRDEINLLMIIEAIEGPLAISKSLENVENVLAPLWKRVQDRIVSELSVISLNNIIEGAAEQAPAHPANPVILCDFDGTISMQDVSDTIFTLWLGETWAEIDREWHEGRMSMVELYEKCWSLVDAGEDEIMRFVDSVAIDEHFTDFVEHCRKAGAPVYLVSDGFDLYIERIMGRYSLDELMHYSNRLAFVEDRPVPEFPNVHPECIQCANCKKAVMDTKREGADFVVYIGNGLSDRCAAEHADLVYAKDALREYCEEKGIAHVPYVGFAEVTEDLITRGLL